MAAAANKCIMLAWYLQEYDVLYKDHIENGVPLKVKQLVPKPDREAQVCSSASTWLSPSGTGQQRLPPAAPIAPVNWLQQVDRTTLTVFLPVLCRLRSRALTGCS